MNESMVLSWLLLVPLAWRVRRPGAARVASSTLPPA